MPTGQAEDEWEAHKATIRTLYIDENRKLQGSEGVMQEMLVKHGLNATKAQYERQFKKWNFRKNKKCVDWEIIARKVAKRKRENKDSDVMIDGKVIPAKKLKKELSRYGYATAFPHNAQASVPKTPKHLSATVYTPPPLTFHFDWPTSLPWLQFGDKYSRILQASNFSLSSTRTGQHNIIRGALSTVLENVASSKEHQVSIGADKLLFTNGTPAEDQMKDLAMADSIFSPGVPLLSSASIEICLYSLSNNLVNDLGDKLTTIAFAKTFLDTWGNHLRKLLSSPNDEPTLVALVEKCFQSACNSGDRGVMELCLKIGVSPNLPVWYEMLGRAMKPIQGAAYTGDINMVNLLMRYRVDVDGVVLRTEPTALAIAFLNGHMAVARSMLDSGASTDHWFDCNAISEYSNGTTSLIPPKTWLKKVSPLSILVAALRYDGDFNYRLRLLEQVLDKAAIDCGSEARHNEHLAHLMSVVMITPSKLYFVVKEIFQKLIRSGGNINDECISGILPISLISRLQTHCCKDLLSLGATPSPPSTSQYYRIRPAALHCTALSGDTDTVHNLLSAGADVNHYVDLDARDHEINSEILMLDSWSPSDPEYVPVPMQRLRLKRYHTPLQFALAGSSLRFGRHKYFYLKEVKKVEVAQLLLARGAKLHGGELADAVELESLELIKLLHRAHAAPLDEKGVLGWTPVQVAIHHKLDDIAKFLIGCGAALDGREMFDAIAAKRPKDFIEYLQKQNTTPSKNALTRAMLTGDKATVARFMHGSSQYDPYALWSAVVGLQSLNPNPPWSSSRTNGFMRLIIKYLQRIQSTVSSRIENTGIAMAAYYGERELLEIYLQKFTSVGSQNCYLPFESTESLLDYDWSIIWKPHNWLYHVSTLPTLRCSPIVAALVGGSEWLAGSLLQHGFRPDGTAVLLAVFLKRQHLLAQMLQQGADPNSRFLELDTPLQMAIRLNCLGIVDNLLQYGVNVNADPPPSPWGRRRFEPRTALQQAVDSGNIDLVRRLIDAGADVNAPAAHQSGATALQLAATRGFIGLAKLLLENGADMNAPGAVKAGRTALETAGEHGRIDMIQFFLDITPGAQSEDVYAPQYIRAVRRAELNGHMAAAAVLRSARRWNLQDYELYDKYEELGDQDDKQDESSNKYVYTT